MTDRYAVIGNPISHSKSPLIHKLFAEQAGEDISYEAILSPIDGFEKTVREFIAQGGKGMSVTVPFKFEAFHLATQLTERATAAKAVNTLKFDGDAILGDNTDGAGLVRDIKNNLNFSLDGRRIFLMGTGGAAWGALTALQEEMCQITIGYRNPEKAQLLVDYGTALRTLRISSRSMAPLLNSSSYENLTTGKQTFELIINATSAGLTDSEIPLPQTIFAPGALAYDMMYGCETPFMKFSRQHGAQVADGLGMLVEQAAEAFYLWRGVRPETAPVIAALRSL